MGIKSPSENYCTSEPFFSAYERLLGGEHDALILLTDYQTAKKSPPLNLQIIKYQYLTKSEVADNTLCDLARKNRAQLLSHNEAWVKRVFKLLAYVNQSDWRAKQLLKLLEGINDPAHVQSILQGAVADFNKKNAEASKKDKEPIPQSELTQLQEILNVKPLHTGVIDALDNWVNDYWQDAARAPSLSEWNRLKTGPLNGKIGMSFALQWRYNFGRLFK